MGVSLLVALLGPYRRFLPCASVLTCPGYVIWGGIDVLMVFLQDRWNLVTINAFSAVCGVLGYPKGSAAELLDGSLKLRRCTTVSTKQFPLGFT